MAAAFDSEHPTPGANNSNNCQEPYESLRSSQMIGNSYAVPGGDYRTPGANNSNDHLNPREQFVANAMIEMAPSGNNHAGLVGERSPPQELSEMRQFRRKVVYLLVACLLVLIGFGVTFVLLWTLRTPKEDGSLSSSLDVLPSAFPTSTEATTTEATTTEATTTEATTTEATTTEATTTEATTTEAVYPGHSFKFLTSLQSYEGALESASYKADGDILVGTNAGVKLVDRKNMVFTSYNTSFTWVTSIIEHHNVTYLLHLEGNTGKVESCPPPNLNNCQTLFTLNKPIYYTPKMAASSRYIVVHDGDDKLIIYDLISKHQKIKETRSFYSPYLLPDGHLLASSEPTLSKYRLEAGEPIKLWTCDGLADIFNVVADAEGYIYALTGRSRKIVYIISPDGELLQTIHNDKLPMIPRQASIRGNEMAVPGGGDNYLHLFQINKLL